MSEWSDDFNRADGPVGNGWSTYGACSIVSGQIHFTQASKLLWRSPFADNGVQRARIDVLSANPVGQFGAILLRYTQTPASYFTFQLLSDGIHHTARIQRYVYPGASTYASATWDQVAATEHTIEALYNHGALSFWVDGTLRVTWTPADVPASTNLGVKGIGDGHVDNFICWDTPGAATFDTEPEPIIQMAVEQQVTFTGTGTEWEPGTPGQPIFTVDKGTLSNQSISSATTASADYLPPQADDTATFTDPSTGQTDVVALSTGFQVEALGALSDLAVAFIERSAEDAEPNSGDILHSGMDIPTYEGVKNLLTGLSDLNKWIEALMGDVPAEPPATPLLDGIWWMLNGHEPADPENNILAAAMGAFEAATNAETGIDGIRTANLLTLQDILDAFNGSTPNELTAIHTHLHNIVTAFGYDLGDVLQAIAAVRGTGNPTIKTIWDELLSIRTAENYNLDSVRAWVNNVDADLAVARQNILDAIDGIEATDLTGVLAAIAAVRGADNIDLTSLHNQTGQLAIDELAHYGQVRADIAGVRGADSRDLTQVYDKIGPTDLTDVLDAIEGHDTHLSNAVSGLLGSIATVQTHVDGVGVALDALIDSHDSHLSSSTASILAAIALIPTTPVDLAPLSLAISNLSNQLTNAESHIISHIPESIAVDQPYWPGIANVTLGDAVNVSGDAEVLGPLDGLLVELTQTPGPNQTWTAGGVTYFKWVGYLSFKSDHGEIEPTQMLGPTSALYVPRSMLTAQSAVVHCNPSVAASVRPWTRNA